MNSNLRSLSRSFSSGFKSVESSATALSTDKNVLYIMLVIAVVNVLGYLMLGNFEAVVFFAIVAYLSTFFTKNMVIVFLIAILATNFLMVSKVNYFKNVAARGHAERGRQDTKEKPTPSSSPSPSPSASPSASPSPSASKKPTPSQPTKPQRRRAERKRGMNGKLAPAKFNDDNESDADDDADSAPFPSSKAQQAKNVEKAHDNLQNIAGSGGGMSAQTEQIMQQQKILMDNMKTMQPFLETAERFLDKFNMKGIDGLLGKIGLGGGTTTPSNPPTGASA
jgi:pyruvate/2-oxoglutarate dehydrogenase complex dihydrolipoamide acyltransferase (E2) component